MSDLEKLKIEYQPIIQSILNENTSFYQFKSQIEWKYTYKEDIGVIASCSRSLVLNINIAAIEHIKNINQPLILEFYILHELRHLYQRICVLLFKENPQNSVYRKAEQWEYEFNNYIDMYKDRESYYYQSIEFDAFSFSYAVMLYKYGKVDYIYPPTIYKHDGIFSEVVNKWVSHFKSNKY